MTHTDIIKLSPEGHVAIPPQLRKGFKGGDTLLVIRDGNRLILERVSEMDHQLKEDLEFARLTGDAWKRYEKGEFRSLGFDEFIIEMTGW